MLCKHKKHKKAIGLTKITGVMVLLFLPSNKVRHNSQAKQTKKELKKTPL